MRGENVDQQQEKKHFAASELAGLLGMPTTKRRVNAMAIRLGWQPRERAARGGGREYPIDCLPPATQAAIAALQLNGAARPSVEKVSPCTRAEARGAHFDARPESLKAEARARLSIVQEYHQLLARGFDRAAVTDAVTRERSLSEATLGRYLALVRGEPEHLWLYRLCPAYAGRTAIAALSAEAWEFLKAEYLAPERRSASACIDRLRRAARDRGWKVPSPRTLLRRLEKLPRAMKVYAREGRKAALQLYPAQARSRAALCALAIVNADGYKHNVWVRFPDGEVRRAQTWFWQDVYSSKMLAWRTDKTEHTEVIRLSFGDLCKRWGIPDAALIDNTLAAANKTMSGGVRHRFRFKVREDEPLGVFELLNVRVMWATPGHGQAKPIERAFGAGGIGEYVDKAPEFAGAWTGSSTADKPDYESKHRAVALAELETVIEREVAAWNAREGRRSGMANGRSFDQVFDESYQTIAVRRATEAQMRLWLLGTEEIAVGRDGTIRLDSGRMVGERLANRYWSEALVDYAGRKVVARFDPKQLHEGVHVYTADGRYITFAECVDPAAFNDQSAAREHARSRRTFVRATKQ